MGKAQRERGKRGELLWRDECRKHGYNAQRGSQSNGAVIADVIGLPGIHIECKFVERLNLRSAMAQSEGDAKEGEIPIVAHKMNRKPWLVTMNSEDFFKLYKAWVVNSEVF
jgi:Holliday junction resolvase